MKNIFNLTIQILAFYLTSMNLSFAAEVMQVNGNQILISSEDEKLNLDQKIYLKEPDSERRTGVAVIRRRNGNENTYVAEVLNGKVREGYIAETVGTRDVSSLNESNENHFNQEGRKNSHRRPNQDNYENNNDISPFEKSSRTKGDDNMDFDSLRDNNSRSGRNNRGNNSTYSKKMRFGIGLGFVSSTLNVQTSTVTANMKGNGFSFRVHMIMPFSSQLQGLGGFGIQPLQTSGTNTLGNTSQVNISYLAFEGMLRYLFNKKGIGFWMGAGGSFLTPSSKDSNILSSDSIATNNTMNVGAGYDFRNGKNLMMLKADYGMLPSTKTSTTASSGSQLNFSFGYFF